MSQWRILLVEDNPGDERLIREHLLMIPALEITVLAVQTLKGAVASLSSESFDLILSDLNLPDSKELETVASILAHAQGTPVVVLTGAQDSDLAERAIHSGAQDYLPKAAMTPDLLERTVRYAIDRQRTREQIRQSEQQFRAFFEASPLAIVIARPEGEGILDANPRFLEMTGYSHQELSDLTIARITHPDDLQDDLQGIRRIIDGQAEVFTREKRVIRKDGSVLWARVSCNVLRDAGGVPETILMVQQDITAEKQASLAVTAERSRLQSVMETMPAFLYLQAPDYSIPFANQRFRELFGEPGGRPCYEIFRNRDIPCDPCSTLAVLESGEEIVREWTDDQGRVFEIRERPFETTDGNQLVLVIGTEITNLVQATQALRESERRFRQLAEMLPEVVFECDLDGQLTFVNQVAFERFGYSKEAYEEGFNAFELVAPEERKRVRDSVARLVHSGEERRAQYTAVRSDGTRFPAIIHSSLVKRDGNPLGLRGILVDISEQIDAQRLIAESEARHRLLFEESPIGIGYHDIHGITLAINQAAVSRLKGSKSDYLGRNLADYSNDPEKVRRRFKRAFESEVGISYEDQVERQGEALWYHRTYTAMRDPDGQVTGIQVTSADITEQKNAELRFQIAATTASDLIYEWDLATDRVRWFGDIDAALGYPEGTVIHTVEGWKTLVHPDDHARLAQAERSHRTAIEPIHQEYRIRTATGEWRNWMDRSTPILGASGGPTRWIGICEDVTEELKARVMIEESERRYRGIIESSPVGIVIVDKRGMITSANPAFLAMTGFEENDFVGRRFTEIPGTRAGDIPKYVRAFREIVSKRRTAPFAATWTSKSGQARHGEVQIAIRSESENDWFVQVIVQDVTDRIEAEEALRRSEANYRSLFENSALGIYRSTQDGRILAANQALVELLGYNSFEELASRNLEDDGYEPETSRSYFRQRIGTKGHISGRESAWKRSDGSIVHIREHARVVRDDAGHVAYYEGTLEDITERKLAEQKLSESVATQQGILRASPVGIGLIRDGTIQWVSDRICKLSGYTADELIGSSPAITAPSEQEYERIRREMAPDLIHSGVAHTETRWVCKDGTQFDVDLSFASLDISKPEFGGIFTIHDITERKQIERSLQLTQYSIDSTNVIILWVLPSGQLVYANDAASRLLGYSREELLSKYAWDITPDYPRDRRAELWERLKLLPELGETIFVRKDGSRFHVGLNARYLEFQGEEYEFVLATDITERKATEIALQQSEENYRTIFNSASDTIMLHNSETGRLVDANQKVEDMFGWPVAEFLELEVSNFSAEDSQATQDEALRLIHAAAAGAPQVFEWHCRRRSGELFWVEVSLRRVALLGNEVVLAVVRDISERKTLEADLRQSQKLESIGTLASGVAHEINNPLMGMINYAELISSRIEDPTLREFAEGIKEEGDRVAKIVRNLLSFSRQDREEHSLARMIDIVNAALSLIGSLLRKDLIQLTIDVPDTLPSIRCRSQQIQQVIINLVTNARDSLNAKYPSEAPDKIVRVTSTIFEESGSRWLRTTVEDRGIGMTPDVANRVFDPFFTTKSRDEGTGLGLSISYGIVRDHDGRLLIDSVPDRSTRFHVDLPLSD